MDFHCFFEENFKQNTDRSEHRSRYFKRRLCAANTHSHKGYRQQGRAAFPGVPLPSTAPPVRLWRGPASPGAPVALPVISNSRAILITQLAGAGEPGDGPEALGSRGQFPLVVLTSAPGRGGSFRASGNLPPPPCQTARYTSLQGSSGSSIHDIGWGGGG